MDPRALTPIEEQKIVGALGEFVEAIERVGRRQLETERAMELVHACASRLRGACDAGRDANDRTLLWGGLVIRQDETGVVLSWTENDCLACREPQITICSRSAGTCLRERAIVEPDHAVAAACTCTHDCVSPCKGACGCKVCHDAYMDFLSKER